MEGRESFVDDLIGYRVLYGVRDALLHRSLEIQPWYSRFVILKFLSYGRNRREEDFIVFFSSFFLRWGDCWVLARVGLATRRSDRKQKTKIKIFGLAPESGARHFARVVKGLAC